MDDLLAIRATLNHDTFTTAEALATGCTPQGLTQMVKTGEITRLATGVYAARVAYAAADAIERHAMTASGVVRQRGPGFQASHYSALALMEIPLWNCNLGRVHISRTGDGSPRRTKALSIHKACGTQSLGHWERIPCVPPALAVIGAATEAGYECGVVTADAVLARRLATVDELEFWIDYLAGTPHIARARRAVAFADARSESIGESRARIVIDAVGLPAPTPQVDIFDGDRLVGRVDFLFEDYRTIVEFDGMVKYDGAEGKEALAAEKAREDWLRSLGYEVVRLVWADLANPDRVRALIVAAFVRRGARPLVTSTFS